MKIAVVKITGVTPYSQSKNIEAPSLPKEKPDDKEARTWRERMHVDAQGMVFIPGMAIKNCLYDAASYLGIQIPGKGKSTYKKHFEAGVLVLDNIPLNVAAKDVPCDALFVPSNGQRGGDKRVKRFFPRFDTWGGEITIHILDETITQDVFMDHFEQAGQFIGLGRFRPRRGGFYGRFHVELLSWE